MAIVRPETYRERRLRYLGGRLIECLNKRDAVRSDIARLQERLGYLLAEQDRIERTMSRVEAGEPEAGDDRRPL